MIKSMTGYGRGEWSGEGKKVEVEIKSFNHRYCDISLRLPRRLTPLENQARTLVRQRVSRGRVEIFVQVEDTSLPEQKLELDLPLAKDFYLALKGLQENLGLPGEVRIETMASFKEIFARKETETDLEKEWGAVQSALDGALTALDAMRRDEGIKLGEDLMGHLQVIAARVREIEERAPQSLQACRDRLAQRVQELSEGIQVDEARLVQEVAFMAERCDIAEEVVRIRSHLDQFEEMLKRPEPAGRKLEFLLQEINREANTIGSKADDAPASHLVVEIKSELEKIREQIQNVE